MTGFDRHDDRVLHERTSLPHGQTRSSVHGPILMSMGTADSGARPGWIRGVELPRSLDELRGPTSAVVRLPLRLYWSGPDPRAVEWRLDKRADCRWLYEIVLREGTVDDVRELVDGATLVQVWDELYLPPMSATPGSH